jgi:predicted RNA polymerase sigma factor
MQDRSKWDKDLISREFAYLEQASTGTALTEYHLEEA